MNRSQMGSSRRDVPAERLYKVLWVAEKGGSRPGFGITHGEQLTIQAISLTAYFINAFCQKWRRER